MKRRKQKQAEYAFIGVKVDEYSARAEAGVNFHLHGSFEPFSHEDEPVHSFETVLHISGICTDPEDRTGHRYDITLYGMADVRRHTPRIKDLQELDEHGSLKYRPGRTCLCAYAAPHLYRQAQGRKPLELINIRRAPYGHRQPHHL
jgi:hypothetical protein